MLPSEAEMPPRAAGADDHDVEGVVGNGIGLAVLRGGRDAVRSHQGDLR